MKLKPKLTEAKIQCELYRQLTNLGYDVWPELSYQLPTGRIMRADLTVMQGDDVLMLIEVKRNNKHPFKHTKQFAKYEATNHPFTYCRTMGELAQTVSYVEQVCSGHQREPIERPIERTI